jgi:hypothetical protein
MRWLLYSPAGRWEDWEFVGSKIRLKKVERFGGTEQRSFFSRVNGKRTALLALHELLLLEKKKGCPLVLIGQTTTMTREGFIRACSKLRRRKTWKSSSHIGKSADDYNVCTTCTRGVLISKGEAFEAPEWIEFESLEEMKRRRNG